MARILLCFPGYWTIAPLNSNWLKLVILFFCFLFELCNFCSKIVFYYPFKSKIVIYSGTLLRKLQRKICKQTSICCLMQQLSWLSCWSKHLGQRLTKHGVCWRRLKPSKITDSRADFTSESMLLKTKWNRGMRETIIFWR